MALKRPTPKLIRRWRGIDWSVSCLMFATMTFFMGIAAFNTQANLLFAVFGLMMGVLIFSLFLSAMMVRHLKIRREMPDSASVGQPAVITYTLTNRKSVLPSLSVSLAEVEFPGVQAFRDRPVAYFLHVSVGKPAISAIEVVPIKRGQHMLGWLQYCTNFPFGYFRIAAIARSEQTFVVYPAIAQVNASILRLFRPANITGLSIRPRRGGSDEFFGLQEYRQGDNPRLIYWKRSAHTGTLVLREMSRVSPPRLVIALDTQVPAGELLGSPQAADLFVERAISMAGSLCSYAIEHDLQVGLIAANGDDRGGTTLIPVSLGKRHRRDLMNLLAGLGRNTSVGAHEVLARADELMDSQVTVVQISAFGGSGGSGGAGAPSSRAAGSSISTPTPAARSTQGTVVVLTAQSPESLSYFEFPPASGLGPTVATSAPTASPKAI